VHASVGQIYVINGGSARAVSVTGPNGYALTTRTDSRGGAVVRDVPAPGAYSVAISGDATSPHAVNVLDANTPPDASFYASQTMSFDPTSTDRTDGYVVTRDCTKLSYRVQFPGPYDPNTRYHVVITYSGYSPGLRPATPWDEDAFTRYTAAGYAVIGVNMRGSGCSGGSFNVMEPIVALDGYDAIETIGAQPWVDGIAMVDKSWPGLSQLFVAATRPPALTAIEPGAPVADFYRDLVYPGGIENVGFARAWAEARDTDNAFPSTNTSVTNVTDGVDKLSVATDDDDPVCLENQKLRGQNVNTVAAFDAHPYYDSYWKQRTAEVDKITVPTLLTVSWQDEQTGARAAEALSQFAPGRRRELRRNRRDPRSQHRFRCVVSARGGAGRPVEGRSEARTVGRSARRQPRDQQRWNRLPERRPPRHRATTRHRVRRRRHRVPN
jgi:predicted acyl esterase